MVSRTLHIADHDIEVSNLGKEFFPEDRLSKGDVIDHYRAVAEAMLPHLRSRPLTMRRFPDGIDGEGFFQKNAAAYFPDWMRVVQMPQRTGGSVDHVLCDDAASLVYLANQATVELHVWLSTVDRPEHPDRMVIDIDPPAGIGAPALHDIARSTRNLCSKLELRPFTQATGGRGYHVVAPLDRTCDFGLVGELAAGIADRLAAREPERLTTAHRRQRRGDRVFLDTGRNSYGQTFIAPYSLRARPGAAVATPLDWPEIGRSTPNGRTPASIRRRLARKRDPWWDIDEHAASAEEARERLDALRS